MFGIAGSMSTGPALRSLSKALRPKSDFKEMFGFDPPKRRTSFCHTCDLVQERLEKLARENSHNSEEFRKALNAATNAGFGVMIDCVSIRSSHPTIKVW